MAKKRRGFFSPRSLLISLIVLGGLAYSLYRFVPREQADVFFVTEPPLEYGDTVVIGTIYKDAPVGELGNYYLATAEGRAIMLDIENADALLGLEFTASGYLAPAASDAELPFMSVASLETT